MITQISGYDYTDFALHVIRPDQYRGETSPCLCAGRAPYTKSRRVAL